MGDTDTVQPNQKDRLKRAKTDPVDIDQSSSAPVPEQKDPPGGWFSFRSGGATTPDQTLPGADKQRPLHEQRLDPKDKARLLYNYCIASDKNVPESVHSLFTIAEHYASATNKDLHNPETFDRIPTFFDSLAAEQKSIHCYNQVTDMLSSIAMPVTVNSLMATRRSDPDDPKSSFAGRFVSRVTRYVFWTLFAIFLVMAITPNWNSFAPSWLTIPEGSNIAEYISWVAFGCAGALLHLLNHALTATRLKTFEASEERKILPRIVLGGMYGFVIPWILVSAGVNMNASVASGPVAAFLGGYSVRFASGLVERVLNAFMPDTDARR